MHCLNIGLDESLFLSSCVWLCIYCVTWPHCYCVWHIPTTTTWILAKQSLSERLWSVNVNILSCSHGPISQTVDELIIRSSDNDSTGLWPPGSLHTLGADGHISRGTFNKEIGFLCVLKFFALNIFCGEYLQSSLHLMLQIWRKPLLWKMCQ